MTVRKLNKLIEIAKEYKMHPLVHYYELKKELIRTQQKLKSEQRARTLHDPAKGWVTEY